MTTASNKPTKRKTPSTPAKAAKAAKATKPTTTKSTTKSASGKRKTNPGPEITPERRHQLIAEAAYLRAESRDFNTDDPVSDWLAAEKEIDARLGEQTQGSSKIIH